MRFVLDASIAMCWLYPDEQDERADTALSLLKRRSQGLVPGLWWYEIRNAGLVGTRRSRISDEDLSEFLTDMHDLPITAHDSLDEDAIFTLARRHRLTFYDACYLELAQREGIALATLDIPLAAAAKAEGIALVGSD